MITPAPRPTGFLASLRNRGLALALALAAVAAPIFATALTATEQAGTVFAESNLPVDVDPG